MIDVEIAAGQITAVLLAEIDSAIMTGYPDGEVPDKPPTPPNDLRVKPYWVAFFSPGAASPFSLGGFPLVTKLPFTITVAGGTKDRALFGVELVRKAISGVEIESGLISEDEFDPGTLRRDDNVVPPRHFVPMSFLLEP